MDMDEEISFILDKANENCKFNEIKNYLPEKIDIELFPTEKKNLMKITLKMIIQKRLIILLKIHANY